MGKHGINYILVTNTPRWLFLNGYTCNSKSKDHFLRHLGYKFGKLCDMSSLNNAYNCGEIGIKIYKEDKSKVTPYQKPNVINEYFDDFGYMLVINHGGIDEEIIEKRLFTNDIEANEWRNSYEK